MCGRVVCSLITGYLPKTPTSRAALKRRMAKGSIVSAEVVEVLTLVVKRTPRQIFTLAYVRASFRQFFAHFASIQLWQNGTGCEIVLIESGVSSRSQSAMVW